MSREVDFVNGVTVVDADWLNAMQEVLSALALNIVVEEQSSTAVRIVAGADEAVASAIINSQIRFTEANKSVTISGAAGTYDIYLTADTGDREFALEATTGVPVATNYRKVAEVPWDGAAIDGPIVNLAASAPTHDPIFTGNVQGVIPAGAMMDFGGVNLPSGFLWCDGSLVDTTTYADLFAALGHEYNGGVDPGGGQFRLPDFRGRVAMAPDDFGSTGAAGRLTTNNTIGDSGGAETHALSVAEMPSHNHGGATVGNTATTNSTGSHQHNAFNAAGERFRRGFSTGSGQSCHAPTGGGTAYDPLTAPAGSHSHTVNSHVHGINAEGSGTAHENLVPYQVATKIIKI